MRNIEINTAESIFEPFWDGGDSYPDNEKYSCLSNYEIIIKDHIQCKIKPTWCAVNVMIAPQNGVSEYGVSMHRRCKLDIKNYDVFRMFAAVPKKMKFRITCVVDGSEQIVIEQCGKDNTGEYDGKITGNVITEIKIEFQNCDNKDHSANILWLGLSNYEKQKEMENKETPYDDSWEGCFNKEVEIKPQLGIYFDSDELQNLRKKVKAYPFNELMDQLREDAAEHLKLVPEKEIGMHLKIHQRRFVRDRDMESPELLKPMVELAFVGIMDENMDMLKMACRIALSVAHCTFWCEGVLGVFPGATWHHRSFTEEGACKSCIKVLDWAGSLLTWHGKNIIYDAIIMKGLPRLEADVKTMDYMWEMNQGIVFSSSMATTYIALQKRYPRYHTRITEAEKDMLTMWENYVLQDGGSAEGPEYWAYTSINIIETLYLLARYHKMELSEYVPESMKKSGRFASCMLSDINNGDEMLPINDTKLHLKYHMLIAAFFNKIKAGGQWENLYKNYLNKKIALPTNRLPETIIMAQEKVVPGDDNDDVFVSLPITGRSALRRYTNDFNVIGLHTQSGAIVFGHCHEDKGSFILEADKKAILIDRGACDYAKPYIHVIGRASVHNLLQPQNEDILFCQIRTDDSCRGEILQSEYDGSVFTYATDLSSVWENGIFIKNIRRIASPNPYIYVINDDVLYKNEMFSSFRLNTYGHIIEKDGHFVIISDNVQLSVYTVNWKPEKAEYGEEGFDGVGNHVNQLRLYTNKSEGHNLVTVLEISKLGCEKLQMNSKHEFSYDNTRMSFEDLEFQVNGTVYKLK